MPRRENDNYETPEWVTNALLEHHPLRRQPMVLEPCAGSGAICRGILARYPESLIESVEIREEERDKLSRYGEVHIADFLTWQPKAMPDYIITNPPFSLAMNILEHALDIADGRAQVIMLLRLAFLEAEKRYDFWQRHPAGRIYVLSSRPSFLGDSGTDRNAVAWFVWGNYHDQKVKVIDSPTRPRKGGSHARDK